MRTQILALVALASLCLLAGCSQDTSEPDEGTETSQDMLTSSCAVITGKSVTPGYGGRTYWTVTNYCGTGVSVRIDIPSHQDTGCQYIGAGQQGFFSMGIGNLDPSNGFGERGVAVC